MADTNTNYVADTDTTDTKMADTLTNTNYVADTDTKMADTLADINTFFQFC